MRPTFVSRAGGCFLDRAIDSTGATIDFMLSGLRDAAAAKRLFRKALTDPSHPQPGVINTDQARLYGSAILGMKRLESCDAVTATGRQLQHILLEFFREQGAGRANRRQALLGDDDAGAARRKGSKRQPGGCRGQAGEG